MTNYLAQYSYFTNEFDLEKALSDHQEDHWWAMNKTDRDILNIIYHFSIEFGAAHLKHATIATAIGKSNVTVRRAIRKLVKLGIVDRVHYICPVTKGLGANIYAIRPS